MKLNNMTEGPKTPYFYFAWSLRSACPVAVSVGPYLFGLTSCLAKPYLRTFVRKLYSVHYVHTSQYRRNVQCRKML